METVRTGPAGPREHRTRQHSAWQPGWRAAALGALFSALVLGAAACGGGGGSAVAHVGTTRATTTTVLVGPAAPTGGATYQKAVAFAQCMRKDGVPAFPDPNSKGQFVFGNRSGTSGLNPGSPQFEAAQKSCQKLLPAPPTPAQQSTLMAEVLKFAQCMRKNGVPNFPEPKQQGGGKFLLGGAGIDPSSPRFQSAMQACHSLLPLGGQGAP